MSGGLVQLVVYGTQNIFLTGTPEITFFKISYRRHTPFAVESIEQELTGSNNFGNEVVCSIDKIGDLISNSYLEVVIPKVDLVKNSSNWDLNLQLAKSNYNEILELYQLVYNYTTTDTDITRKLLTLCRTNNIPMSQIVETMNDPEFIGELTQQRQELQTYILLSENFNNIDELTDEKFYLFQEVNRTDIQIQFNSIVSITQDVNATTDIDELDGAIRIQTINLINNKMYQIIKDFYMKIYIIYIEKYNIYQSFINGTYSESYKFAWVEELGNAMIDGIDLTIGSDKIETHTGDFLMAFSKVFENEYQKVNYNKMIGNVPELYEFNNKPKESYKIIVPLKFFFCRHYGLAIPLVALRYHDVLITLRYKIFEQLCYFEDSPNLQGPLNVQALYNINLISAKLFIDYVFLDESERKRFAQSTHEYLIEIVQYREFNNLEGREYNADLSFSHPTKFMIWFVQPNTYRNNPKGTNKCQWNNYGTNNDKSGYTITNEFIRLNTQQRTDPNHDIKYYNYVIPYELFQNSPTDGYNIYSFAIKPMELQPSSSCNMSRISDLGIVMNFTEEFVELVNSNTFEEIPRGFYLGVYCYSINILRIMSGMAGVAFQTSS